MGNLIHFQEYQAAPAKVKLNGNQIRCLLGVLMNANVHPKNTLERNAIRDIIQKLYLKLVRKVVMPGKQISMRLTDPEMWALSFVLLQFDHKSYERCSLHPIIDLIERRIV